MPNWGDETPKPSKALPISATGSSSEATVDSLVLNATPTRKGFTLSFLRRIPELSQLAKRIIEVEAKRRAKEEREKSRLAAKTGKASNPTRSDGRRGVGEAPTNPSTLPTSLGKSTKLKRHGSTDKENDQGKGSMPDALPRKDKEMMGPRIKRLFTFAIRRLYDEGSIVLWEGPIHPCDGDSLGIASDGISSVMSQSLWRTSSSRHVSQASAVEFSTSSVSSMSVVNPSFSCEEEAPLSDPQEGEEAYVSVTSAFLAPFVEAAVEELTRRGIKSQRASSASASRSLSSKQPTLSQAGPTQSQITTYLQRADSRWARIGEWSISEALDELQELGRVWVVSGQGKEARWEKCL
ncbi:hypothetical protein ONZ45_g12092 [Pleurotus djamor]|nr:hypothetical protein ONZ45_g12092 [Pleurotus djamor]